MKDVYKQISRTIINKLTIKMMKITHKDDDSLFTDRMVPKNEKTDHYLNLNYFPMVVIDFIDRSIQWDRNMKIIMTSKNQHAILSGMKKMIKIIYDTDIYYLLDGKLKMYSLEDKHVVKIFNAGNNNNIILMPSVVIDNDGKEYEGIRVMINKTMYSVDLSIDEFEALYFNLDRIDMFVYSQILLNYFITYMQKIEYHIVDKQF